jgi:hypothetical protein
MWLKHTSADKLLNANGITRKRLAREFGYSEAFINSVLDGKAEAGEELSRLFISAFGADEMERAIDWERTAA